ncbi:MAG TPA: plasmid stabilization protein [Caulobacteraceae bacterium]|jgi:plastocyanin
MGRLGAAALVAGAAVLAGCGQKPAAPAGRTATIVVDQLAFGPAPEGLKVGDTVVWVNRDVLQHSATAGDKSFDVELPAGASARTTLTKAGTINYVCRYHPGMTGVLRVEPKS